MNSKLTLPVDEPVLTVPEVAAYLKISKSKIYYMVSTNRMPHMRIGRNIRIRQTDLTKWMEERVEKDWASAW